MNEGLSKALESVRRRLNELSAELEALELERKRLLAREMALDALRLDAEGCLIVKHALKD